jgi:ClpP class serine protease
VQKGRGLTDKQLAAAKTGGVFGAAEALDRKLIDGIKGFDEVVTELAAEARRQQSKATRATGPDPVRSAAVDEP